MQQQKINVLAKIKESFIPSLEKQFGESLVSVILYGSAAGTEYHPGSSDINLMAIIRKPSPEAIINLGKDEEKQIRKLRISLQILTSEEFLGSADVFPMEYLDMLSRSQLLFGESLLDSIQVNPKHLRHQVEERLRGSVNAFRQALLSSGKSEKVLKSLLIEWFGAQTALLRGLLRLKGEEHIPFGAGALAERVADCYGIDGSAFTNLSLLRDGEKSKATEVAPHVLRALTELAGLVDSMGEIV